MLLSATLLALPAAAAKFISAQDMAVARFSLTATTLPSGKVLVVGGSGGFRESDRRAELYDPTSRTFSPTGVMSSARTGQTATLLGNGKVLIAGGEDSSGFATASAELYDPSTGTFSATGSMTVPRAFHTATLLPDGRVLIVGGGIEDHPTAALSSAEIYDPGSGSFAATGSTAVPRIGHTATLLANGKVLVVGGYDRTTQLAISSAELYDPASGTFASTGGLGTARGNPTATLLNSGKVLIAGGYAGFPGPGLSSSELYDPTSGTFSSTGSMNDQRGEHTATLLADGKVLVVGGFTDFPCLASPGALSSAEVYDPGVGTFTAAASMMVARGRQAAALLPNGDVLVAGGLGAFCGGPMTSAEVFTEDSTAPTLQTPSVVTVGATVPTGTTVTYTVSATDPDDAAGTPSCSPASGSVFPVGVTIVNCSSTDTHANTGSASFPVDVTALGADCNLAHYSFLKGTSNLNLKGANLGGCYLVGANLANAVATNATMMRADLANASLAAANLTQANLTAAILTGADLSGANLSGANLSGAAMTGAILTGVVWSKTTCPDGSLSISNGGTCIGHLG
jgi:hypothetical protein